jgi:hypothetical protein
MYCQISGAMEVLVKESHRNFSKICKDIPHIIKLAGRCLTNPKTNTISQWIYDSTSKRIKLKLPVRALVSIMKIGQLFLKFPWPLSILYNTLKMGLCLILVLQIFMPFDKLKNSTTKRNGLIVLMLAAIFPFLADIIQYRYEIWNSEKANLFMVFLFSILMSPIKDYLKEAGFKDVLSLSTLAYEFRDDIGYNYFDEKISEDVKFFWNILGKALKVYTGVSAFLSLFLKILAHLIATFDSQNNGQGNRV